MGDHGWHLGEKNHWRKFTLWEEGTRTPLIWIVPGMTTSNTKCDRPVDFMSIYPTLTALAGIPTPKHVAGLSIRQLLADPGAPWATPAITNYRYKNHAARSADWRYIRYENGDEELYDVRRDPNEYVNLAAQSELSATKAALAKFFPAVNHRRDPPRQSRVAGRL